MHSSPSRLATTTESTEYDQNRAQRGVDQALRSAQINYIKHNYVAPGAWTTVWDKDWSVAGDETGIKCLTGASLASSVETQVTRVTSPSNHLESSPSLDPVNGFANDTNHVYPGPGQLNLYYIFRNGSPLPNVANMKNAQLTLTLRAVNVTLPAGFRLFLHYQVLLDSGKYGNFLYYDLTQPTIEELLGFGGKGFGHPNETLTVADSGSQTYTMQFYEEDAFWYPLVSSTSRYATYNEDRIDAALDNGYADMILMGIYPQTYPNTRSRPPVGPTGTIWLEHGTFKKV